MIVRDEAHIVREALESVARFVDDYIVVDTGSTDDTQHVIRSFFDSRGTPGSIVREPFVDFGRSRTRALELARERSRSEYVWVLDADDRLIGEPDLGGLDVDAGELKYGPEFIYYRPQLFRRTAPFRYVGVVHEYATSDVPGTTFGRVGGRYHIESRRLGARNRDRDKYRRDAELLEASLRDNPDDARATFYAGQSWFDAGEFARALGYYDTRAGQGGFEEEVFYSRYRAAQCREKLGTPWDDVREAYLTCFDQHPHRAEPLVHVANRERAAGRMGVAYAIARRAAEVPPPAPGALFAEASAYEFRARDEWAIAAFYVGRRVESFEINTDLLRRSQLPDRDRSRIEANRDFSARAMEAQVLSHAPDCIRALGARVAPPEPSVTLTITACRRFELLVRSMDSFLAACSDVERIGRFVCIDDGSSHADREAMAARYPFFEFIWKTLADRGHARSMNTLRDTVRSTYWLHLEDDFQFFERRDYVTEALAILDHEPTVGQVLFNRGYAEDLDGRNIDAGELRNLTGGVRYWMHVCDWSAGVPPPGRRSVAYWPHFSLRPSLMRTDAIRAVGTFDESPIHFEREFAERYFQRGGRSAFLDTICSRHIGRRTDAREAGLVPNAYQLNGERQFGESQPTAIRITVAVTSFGRPEALIRTITSLAARCKDLERLAAWVCVDYGTEPGTLRQLAARFPFVRFIHGAREDRGRARRLNRLLAQVQSRYVLQLDGAWEFTRDFRVAPFVDVLRPGAFQLVALDSRSSGVKRPDLSAEVSVCSSNDVSRGDAFADHDWPAFTLEPCVFDIEYFRARVGEFDVGRDDDSFEREYAERARHEGARILRTDAGLVRIDERHGANAPERRP